MCTLYGRYQQQGVTGRPLECVFIQLGFKIARSTRSLMAPLLLSAAPIRVLGVEYEEAEDDLGGLIRFISEHFPKLEQLEIRLKWWHGHPWSLPGGGEVRALLVSSC